jgi:hypothetical protein
MNVGACQCHSHSVQLKQVPTFRKSDGLQDRPVVVVQPEGPGPTKTRAEYVNKPFVVASSTAANIHPLSLSLSHSRDL